MIFHQNNLAEKSDFLQEEAEIIGGHAINVETKNIRACYWAIDTTWHGHLYHLMKPVAHVYLKNLFKNLSSCLDKWYVFM